ncbi:IclR family transcriptional regulator C-terminal domain-containing protein [Streptomyces sp. S1D4-11]
MERTRTDGCAHSVKELERGLNAVAAPVFSFNGQVVAALSASGPSFRLTEQRLAEASAAVQAAAEKISDRLGHLHRARDARMDSAHTSTRRPERSLAVVTVARHPLTSRSLPLEHVAYHPLRCTIRTTITRRRMPCPLDRSPAASSSSPFRAPTRPASSTP